MKLPWLSFKNCPAWTRTKTHASKGQCATITPQGNDKISLCALQRGSNEDLPTRLHFFKKPGRLLSFNARFKNTKNSRTAS